MFDSHDTKNQGFIKTSLLGNILRTIGFNPLESDIQRVTREVDPLSKILRPNVFRTRFSSSSSRN